MYVEYDLQIDTRAITARQKRVGSAKSALDRHVVRVVIPASQKRTDKGINADPSPHKHRNDEWESEKQRRWWFAVGVHQWHGRTGAVRKWRIVGVIGQGGGIISANNPAAHAKYVFGPYQQKMHRPTWMNIDTYRRHEGQQLAIDVVRGWVKVNEA